MEKVSNDEELYEVNSVGQITLIFNTKTIEEPFEIIYIIDEASMISDYSEEKKSFAKFGSGRLLSDILSFNPKAKFIFVGDPVQLPPIGQSFSPALSKDYFKKT